MGNIKKSMQNAFQAVSETLRCTSCDQIGQKLYAISCGHLFCGNCLERHSLSNKTDNDSSVCPLCFTKVDPNKTCFDQLFNQLYEANVQFNKITGQEAFNVIHEDSLSMTKEKSSILLERENIDPNVKNDDNIVKCLCDEKGESSKPFNKQLINASQQTERIESTDIEVQCDLNKLLLRSESTQTELLPPIDVEKSRSVETQPEASLNATPDTSNNQKHNCCIEKNLKRILGLNICDSFNAIILALLNDNDTQESTLKAKFSSKLTASQVAIQNQDVREVKSLEMIEANAGNKNFQKQTIDETNNNISEVLSKSNDEPESVSNTGQLESTYLIRKRARVKNAADQSYPPEFVDHLESRENMRNATISEYKQVDEISQKFIIAEKQETVKGIKELNSKIDMTNTKKSASTTIQNFKSTILEREQNEKKEKDKTKKQQEKLTSTPLTRNKRKFLPDEDKIVDKPDSTIDTSNKKEGDVSSLSKEKPQIFEKQPKLEKKVKAAEDKSKEVEDNIENDDQKQIVSQVAMRTRAKRGKHTEPAISSATNRDINSLGQVKKSAKNSAKKVFFTREEEKSEPSKVNVSGEKQVEQSIFSKTLSDIQSNSTTVQSDVFDWPSEETIPAKKITRGRTKKVVNESNHVKSPLSVNLTKDTSLGRSRSRCKEMDDTEEEDVGVKPAKKIKKPLERKRRMSRIIDGENNEDMVIDKSNSLKQTRSRKKFKDYSGGEVNPEDQSEVLQKIPEKSVATPSLSVKSKLSEIVEDSPHQSDSSVSSGISRSSSRPRTSSSEKPKFVILCSCLDGPQKRKVEKMAQLLNFEIVNSWTSSVTHLVVDLAKDTLKKDMLTTRSVKYLQAILANIWIVSMDWIIACANSNRLVEETNYEIRGVRKCIKTDCPQQSRLEKIKFFHKYAVHFKGTFDSFPIAISEVKPLVTIGGGLLVDNENQLDSLSKDYKVIIVNELLGSETQDSYKYVSLHTFLDSITNLERL